jgi:hypothetical protein
MQVPAALSVDLEFFQHAPAYRSAAGTAGEPAIGRDGVDFLLDAFADAGGAGTFFAVSDVVEEHAAMLDAVAKRHEIGSHTHSHRHLSELSADKRRAELANSRERLEAATSADVVGFRAPSFDVADDHFPMLVETGYEYDSSVVPSRSIPGWYGGEWDTWRPSPAPAVVSDAAADPTKSPATADPTKASATADLAEVPVAVMPGLRLPLTGTWIRFFGVYYTILGMRLLARRGIAPVLYVHPWELVDIPKIEGVPSRIYFRSGEYMRRAVERILAEPFEFVPVGALAEGVVGDTAQHSARSDSESRWSSR